MLRRAPLPAIFHHPVPGDGSSAPTARASSGLRAVGWDLGPRALASWGWTPVASKLPSESLAPAAGTAITLPEKKSRVRWRPQTPRWAGQRTRPARAQWWYTTRGAARGIGGLRDEDLGAATPHVNRPAELAGSTQLASVI